MSVVTSAFRGIGSILVARKAVLGFALTAMIMFVPLTYLIDSPINTAIMIAEWVMNALTTLTTQGTQFLVYLLTLPLAVLDGIGAWVVSQINIYIIGNLNELIPGTKADLADWTWTYYSAKFQASTVPMSEAVKFSRVDIMPDESLFDMFSKALFGNSTDSGSGWSFPW